MHFIPFLTPHNHRFWSGSSGIYSITVLLSLVFFLMISLGMTGTGKAQNRVRIVQSDRLEGITTGEGHVRKLIGNVKMETNDFTIVCDSARHYMDLDELQAWGNIEIASDKERIWSDKATYDLISEVTLFEGRVVMQSENTLLFSEEVLYSFATEIALFPGHLRLEDDRGVLLADSGYYYHAIDSAVFRGHVRVADSLQYLEADSMFTNRNDEYYELHGRVFLDDQEHRTRLRGGFALSDSTGYRRVEGGSRMLRMNEAETDTTFLWSDWLEIRQKDDVNTFTAYDKVHIWTDSYSSLSDTADYDEGSEEFVLQGNARLWYDEMQLTGPHILIRMEEDSIRYLEAIERPFAVRQDTSIDRLNQITGDTLFIRFDKGEVSYMDVYPRGNVLYFAKESDGRPDGAIELTADHIKLVFDTGELEDVIARNNVDGLYHPENEEIPTLQLEGFVRDPDLRPTRPDFLMKPGFPAIPKERPFSMPRRFTEPEGNTPMF